jgi:hypothetical protein
MAPNAVLREQESCQTKSRRHPTMERMMEAFA